MLAASLEHRLSQQRQAWKGASLRKSSVASGLGCCTLPCELHPLPSLPAQPSCPLASQGRRHGRDLLSLTADVQVMCQGASHPEFLLFLQCAAFRETCVMITALYTNATGWPVSMHLRQQSGSKGNSTWKAIDARIQVGPVLCVGRV